MRAVQWVLSHWYHQAADVLNVLAINYSRRKDEIITIEQQDAAISFTCTRLCFLLSLHTTRRDETSAILWGVFVISQLLLVEE